MVLRGDDDDDTSGKSTVAGRKTVKVVEATNEDEANKGVDGEAGLGTTVAALMLLCPGSLKETLRGAQASLETVADGLDFVHGTLNWKEENTTWGVVGATVVSAAVFQWVHFSTWLQVLGVTFLLSGTSAFRLAIMLLSGTAGEISGRLLKGQSVELWLERDESLS